MRLVCAGLVASVIAGCMTPQAEAPQITYLGVETKKLDEELVNFIVRVQNPRTALDVGNYALCAAAQYTKIRGFGFARHVRTNLQEEAGIWVGDAVYTLSPTVPVGLETIDADITLADCKARGIATV